MKCSQEAGCSEVGGYYPMKCSWCDELAICGVVGCLTNDR